MKQRFIQNRGKFSLFRLSLLRTGKMSPFGNPLFRRYGFGEIWERYEYDYDEVKRIAAFAFRVLPYPKHQDLIEITVESKIEYEIKGACRLLFELEYKGQDYRSDLIKKLEQSVGQLTEKRFKIICENANLINQGNLRDIMNKTDEEISADLIYYQNLYQRTEKIKRKHYCCQHWLYFMP